MPVTTAHVTIRPGPIIALCLLLVTSAAALGADAPPLPAGAEGYLHNIYWVGGRPTSFARGRCVADISTPERVSEILGELAGLGINTMSYHSVYMPDGALYDTDDPLLQRSWYWPPEARPVDDFLAACARFGIDAWLGTYLGGSGNPLIAEHAADDIIAHFGADPVVKGIIPPIEARYTGINCSAFIDLSRHIKRARPDLGVMDYPSAPYDPQAMQWLTRCAGSRAVDIENVQFHPCDDRLAGLREARGMTLLVIGACPDIRAIVHTHYKNGVNAPDKPTQWLPPERAWDVTQSFGRHGMLSRNARITSKGM